MPRRSLFPQGSLNPVFQVFCQLKSLGKLDKKNDALVSFPILPHNHAISYFLESFHHIVYFSWTYTHSRRLQREIGTPQESYSTSISMDQNPIAVPPNIRINTKVRVSILFVVRVVPEIDGHRWRRSFTNQLRFLIHNR